MRGPTRIAFLSKKKRTTANAASICIRNSMASRMRSRSNGLAIRISCAVRNTFVQAVRMRVTAKVRYKRPLRNYKATSEDLIFSPHIKL
jgi:hypothetical protein